MAQIDFQDYHITVENALKDVALQFLEEASGELEAQAKRNSRVKTGQTKGSFEHAVDDSLLEGYVGSNYENAIWEEFGTGEYAINGDGRKGGWYYTDDSGETHFTYGKTPSRALQNAFDSLKQTIIAKAQSLFGGIS